MLFWKWNQLKKNRKWYYSYWGCQRKPVIAKVLAVGEGKVVDGKLVPVTVKVGQRVVFKKYSTTDFKFKDKEYLIIAEKDILAIVEEV